MSEARGRSLRKSGRLVGALVLLLVMAVQPVLAEGRPANPPPTAATVAHVAREAVAHVPLADLLAHIPDTEANRAWFSYGDVEGWHEAAGVSRISSFDYFVNMSTAAGQPLSDQWEW